VWSFMGQQARAWCHELFCREGKEGREAKKAVPGNPGCGGKGEGERKVLIDLSVS